MDWEEKRKIQQEKVLRKIAADFYEKESENVTQEELSITWLYLSIEGVSKIIRYFNLMPNKKEYYTEENELYTDAIQGAIVRLNRFLPVVPFKHNKTPLILVSAAKADNKMGVGAGWDGEDLFEQYNDQSDEEDISYHLKCLELIKEEFTNEEEVDKIGTKKKDLPLSTDYKYPTKITNSIWTVKNK